MPRLRAYKCRWCQSDISKWNLNFEVDIICGRCVQYLVDGWIDGKAMERLRMEMSDEKQHSDNS